MATVSPEVNDIRRRMAQIRRELHEDVQGVVAGAEAVADWRRWIRNYPWAVCGAAFAIGYLIVPRKHTAAPTIHINNGEPIRSWANSEPEPVVESKKPKKRGLLWKGMGLLAPIVFRAGRNYALQYAETWLAQQMQKQQGGSPDLANLFGMMGTPPPNDPMAQPGAGYMPGSVRNG